MTTASIQKRKGYLAIGGAGILLAAGYLGLALQMPMGQLNSPGAGVFPLIAGSLLLIGSISTVWEGWKIDRAEAIEWPAGDDFTRLAVMVAALIGYLVIIPWIGQLLASVIFCAVLMKLLYPVLSLPGVVLRSVLLMIPVYYIFIDLLRVPMPKGILF